MRQAFRDWWYGQEIPDDSPVIGTHYAQHWTRRYIFWIAGLVVLILVMANMRKPRIPDWLFYALILLTVANVCVAVFWSTVHA